MTRDSGTDEDPEAIRLVAEGNLAEDAGDPRRALLFYEDAIRRAPLFPRAHLNRGNAFLALGSPAQAIDAYLAVLSLDDGHSGALLNLGNAYLAAGRHREAHDAYARSLQLESGRPQVRFGIGLSLEHMGRMEDAIASFRAELELNPTHEAARSRLVAALASVGDSHAREGRKQDAIGAYRRALELRPDWAEASSNLGTALRDLARFDEAIEALEHAVRCAPDSQIVRRNLASALLASGRPREALDEFKRASQLRADDVECHLGIGNALHALNRLEEALASYTAALAVQPRSVAALNNVAITQKDLGLLREAMQTFKQALDIEPTSTLARSNLLFLGNFFADDDGSALTEEARRYGEIVEARAQPYTQWSGAFNPERRLRIGFVSGDFADHPVGFFSASVFAALAQHHGHSLDLVGYATGTRSDATTARIKSAFSEWHSLVGMEDPRAAHRVHGDSIDILVDMSGHTAQNRLPVFAWRPAPLQLSWLAYFATTGVKAIDYFIADPITLQGPEERNFIEKIWRLPHTRLCFTRPVADVPVSPPPSVANGHITFGCFNHLAKVTDDVVGVWCELLRRLPSARLLMKAPQLAESERRELTRDRFDRHGIAGERLTLEGPSARRDYLEAYARVDIALDPFPYTGGATTAEALWMGVPVLTLGGERFLARQGVGMLSNVGLAQWIADNRQNYIERAVAFGSDVPGLVAIRSSLRSSLAASPLMDAPLFAKDFAAALRQMWLKRCAAGAA